MAEIPEKPFYKIGEVCQYTDTQPYVLRFWESEFPRLAPQKSRSGQRMYTRQDIDLVLRIKKLLYEEEFTIAGARKKLEMEESGEATEVSIREPEVPAAREVEQPAEPRPAPLFESAAPAPEPRAPEPPAPREAPAPPAAAAPSPADLARAMVAETEIGALRKRIAELESAKASMTAALETSEAARRRERERRERVASRLEAVLRALDAPASDDAEGPGDLDDRSGIS